MKENSADLPLLVRAEFLVNEVWQHLEVAIRNLVLSPTPAKALFSRSFVTSHCDITSSQVQFADE